MKRAIALSWGLASLIPLVLSGYVYFVLVVDPVRTYKDSEPGAFSGVLEFLLMIVLVLLLLGSFLGYLYETEHLRTGDKLLWGLVLFVGSIFSMPVFWYLHVWPYAPED